MTKGRHTEEISERNEPKERRGGSVLLYLIFLFKQYNNVKEKQKGVTILLNFLQIINGNSYHFNLPLISTGLNDSSQIIIMAKLELHFLYS